MKTLVLAKMRPPRMRRAPAAPMPVRVASIRVEFEVITEFVPFSVMSALSVVIALPAANFIVELESMR
ncbi:MAG: hypothetical protein U1E70_18050 [Acetobacteraceae bacterium]